jgi:ribosomal protein S8
MSFIKQSLVNFASSYNMASLSFKKNFKVKVHDEKLIIFIKKFLIPLNVVLSFEEQKINNNTKQLKIFLNHSHYIRYSLKVNLKEKVFTGVPKKYLTHIKKSSYSIVRDIYILETNEGFFTFEETLQKNLSGNLVMIISFFDYRNTTISRNLILNK